MGTRDEVAIVGFAARLPGARDARAFWHLVRNNVSAVASITPDRFPTDGFLHPGQEQPGRSYTFAAGVIEDPWGFDNSAFGMSPREAEQVDPQQRHLLEVSQDALAHAGIRPSSLAGVDVGVYIGASSVDYATRFIVDPSVAGMHMMTGNSVSIMANRISYSLDLRGPSISIDTACSSSMVALNLAAEAIRSGTIDTAIVGGVNLLLSPFSYVGFSRASMLSPTGRCRPFDAAADGYVRSEGVVIVILRSMAAARRARNRIHAVIVGSGVNQDGRTTGVSLPSAQSQRALLERVYSDFAVDPSDLAFVEAHGTGTPVGDPIEADALGKALGQRRSQILPIGSVKSNIGHLEPASGLAGLLKAIGALNQKVLPATLHQESPNPHIPFDELNLLVPGANRLLSDRRGALLAGVNSFGFGGTNAHVIIRGGEEAVVALPVSRKRPSPLLLSAHSSDALRTLARSYVQEWPSETKAVNEFISAAAHLRDALPSRLLICGGSGEEIKAELDKFATAGASAHALTDTAIGRDLPIAFVFSGNGAQWAGMGRHAWQTNSDFRLALSDLDEHFSKIQNWSLVELLLADDLAQKLRLATFAQPLLFALQVATVRALEALGVQPSAVMGHSVGEVAAAWAAGFLSLDHAIDVVIARSRHQEATHGKGSMAALMLSEQEARAFLSTTGIEEVDIAAINSSRSVTLSGPTAEIDRLVTAAAEARIGARKLDLNYPFHSALVDPVRGPLLRELDGLQQLPQRRPLVSTVLGDLVTDQRLDADYWWRNVRQPVQFEAALNCLIKEGSRVFVEIGPRPILSSYMRDVLRQTDVRGAIIETLTDSASEKSGDPIERAACKILLAGGKTKAEALFGPPPALTVSLPLYPWQHNQFKLEPSGHASTVLSPALHSLLGRKPRSDCTEWFSTVDPTLFPWLTDHKVGKICVFPATAMIEVVLEAGREAYGTAALELTEFTIVSALTFEARASFDTSVRFSEETGIVEFRSRRRLLPDEEWVPHARGVLRRSPISAKMPRLQKSSGTTLVPQSRVYAKALELGFDYGPQFQRCRHVEFPEPKCAVAVLSRERPPGSETHVSDLTAFDAAFHALFASEDGGVADMPMTRMLPVAFGCTRIYAAGKTAARVVARTLRQSSTSIVLDIDLLDEEDNVVLSAERVRLRQAPAETEVDRASLLYKVNCWRDPSAFALAGVHLHTASCASTEAPAASLSEALLLLEAGCLRASWNAVRDGHASESEAGRASQPWRPFLHSALVGQLMARGLATYVNGAPSVEETCDLPDVSSIVSTLLLRHPTMANEAASLARIDETLAGIISGNSESDSLFSSQHRRELRNGSSQVSFLRQVVLAEAEAALRRADRSRLLRLVVVGAHNAEIAERLCVTFPNLEVIITDPDANAIEQAEAALDAPNKRLRLVPSDSLPQAVTGPFDLAVVIDGLAELALNPAALPSLLQVLRPGAPILAGELPPSLYWDVVRGNDLSWWRRSTSSEVPVSALLSGPEWTEELQAAGFVEVSTELAGEGGHAGIILRATTAPRLEKAELPVSTAVSWLGDSGSEGSILGAFKDHLHTRNLIAADGNTPSQQVVIAVDATTSDPGKLCDLLADLAALCRETAAAPRPLCVVMDFGSNAHVEPLDAPVWCSVVAALRVAQNEYSGLQLRCIGVAGGAGVAGQLERELISASPEREVFFAGEDRWVFRIESASDERACDEQQPARSVSLTTSRIGHRAFLSWTATDRGAPKAGEVEIEVSASGVNFRDVMWHLHLLPEEALEDGYVGPKLGMECAGTIVRVGAGVETLKPGDRVAAFASGAFASHVVVPAFAVMRLPHDMSSEAAATLPVAFLTAYYSLFHLSRLSRGQTILIHGAAGGVGLAAIQLALQCGAKVIATAGTEGKRALLRNIGVDLVCNSRSLAFADEILAYTHGKGVDVVLNSLAGEAMVRSFDCVKPFGRFVELGKRDFYANTHIGLKPFRRNVSYFAVDVDQLIGERRGIAQRLFGRIERMLLNKELVPLPYRVFPGERIADAFRLMQRSGHIGKLLVKPGLEQRTAQGQFPVDPEGLHVVIGGTSGFGLATAGWLVQRGAKHVLLVSRSGTLSEKDLPQIEAMRSLGAEVETRALDVTEADSLERLLCGHAAHRKIAGIVHAAMIVDDRLIENMDRMSIDTVLQPKVAGALNLEALMVDLKPNYLLLYSSATTLFGNPGQYNYVAANAFMEGIARRLRKQGLPAFAIAWGGIADVGYLSRHIGNNTQLKKRFSANLVASQIALDSLDDLFDGEGRPVDDVLAIAKIDWATARRDLVSVRGPAFTRVVAAAGTSRDARDSAAIVDKIRAMPDEEAAEAFLDIIAREIGRVLRVPAKEVHRHRPLAEVGMDSLMMLELRMMVEDTLQIELPMISLASGITPADVAKRLVALLRSETPSDTLPSNIVALSASHFAADAVSSTPEEQQAAVAAVLSETQRVEGPL
jgi:phthiocerol/phenolphthiocerol synthesis type-I polyketide synthase C